MERERDSNTDLFVTYRWLVSQAAAFVYIHDILSGHHFVGFFVWVIKKIQNIMLIDILFLTYFQLFISMRFPHVMGKRQEIIRNDNKITHKALVFVPIVEPSGTT